MSEELVREAFVLLYSTCNVNSYKFSLTYSGRFKDYGANVKYCMNKVDFSLSKKWKNVNKNIVIGLLHELFVKVFKAKNPSTYFYIDLYNAFIRNAHIAAPKTKFEPLLEESFDRVNEKYFHNSIEKPNLIWGKNNRRKLGCYDFNTDTITISRIFKNKDFVFLDYVMYHEMLHKDIKFDSKKGKSRFHSKEFRRREKEFENAELIEKAINNGFRTQKRLNLFQKLLFKQD